jgi:tRNA dimethylallyltransferase
VKVVIVSGATATGKTDLAIELAHRFGGEIVNFDSLLLYKEITIGTAKPTPEEMKQIPHHMINVSSISEPLNAADYSRLAHPIVDDILSRNKTVYLVGGSGFYLQALVKGMYDSPTTPKEISEQSDELYESQGIEPFLSLLKIHDPASFARYHANDHYRVRRAVEHWWTNKTPLSEARTSKDEENKVSQDRWENLNLYLEIPRDQHFEYIKARTEKMISAGLVDEVRDLLGQGFTGQEKPLQSIGYKEVLEFLDGSLPSLDDCRARIDISTRQLAKSQRTWFNRDKTKLSFHPLEQRDEIFKSVQNYL